MPPAHSPTQTNICWMQVLIGGNMLLPSFISHNMVVPLECYRDSIGAYYTVTTCRQHSRLQHPGGSRTHDLSPSLGSM